MSINFSSTTPAAPAGSVLVVPQNDGAGNQSFYVPSSAPVLTTVDLTAQDANIGTTTIVSAPATGRYRVSVYTIVTTPDGASSTLPSVVIGWTDPDNATSQTFTLTATAPTGNTKTTYAEIVVVISATTSTNISYATTSYASGTPTAMKYALHLVLEQI
jgi:hypothetical protein